jgi:hypothetical protein
MFNGFMMQSAPALGILIDLPLGLFMWTCLLRFVLSIFISEDSKVAPMRMLTAFTHPVTKVASLIAPGWMISRLEPLYAALVILVLRYYVFPLVIGYDIYGPLNMPLESMLLSVYADYLQ